MANASNTYANNTFLKLISASQTVTGDFSITGNLFIGGNTTAVSANNLIVNDPLIYLANGNLSDILDIGFVGSYVNTGSAHVHTGLYRDHSSKKYYLFQGYDGNPDNNNDITPYSNNMVNAVLVADLLTSNLTLGSANAIVWIKSAYDTLNAGFTVANAAYNNANVGLIAANTWANTVGTSGNAYAIVVGASGNAYINLSTTAANNYAGAMANSVNAYTLATYSTLTQFSSVFGVSNSSYTVANSAYGFANGVNTFAYGVAVNAAAAFAAANNVSPQIAPTRDMLNVAFGVANVAFDKANSANVLAYNTGISANNYAGAMANASNNHAGAMANAANAYARVFANNVGYSANTYIIDYSTSLFATIANTDAAFYRANLVYEYANGISYNAAAGFAFANGINTFAYGVSTNTGAAFDEANLAFTLANNAYNYANTISAASGSGFIYSTIFTFPTGDLGTGETYPGSTGGSLTDAFGVNLSQSYDSMEPVGQIKVTDLGVLT